MKKIEVLSFNLAYSRRAVSGWLDVREMASLPEAKKGDMLLLRYYQACGTNGNGNAEKHAQKLFDQLQLFEDLADMNGYEHYVEGQKPDKELAHFVVLRFKRPIQTHFAEKLSNKLPISKIYRSPSFIVFRQSEAETLENLPNLPGNVVWDEDALLKRFGIKRASSKRSQSKFTDKSSIEAVSVEELSKPRIKKAEKQDEDPLFDKIDEEAFYGWFLVKKAQDDIITEKPCTELPDPVKRVLQPVLKAEDTDVIALDLFRKLSDAAHLKAFITKNMHILKELPE